MEMCSLSHSEQENCSYKIIIIRYILKNRHTTLYKAKLTWNCRLQRARKKNLNLLILLHQACFNDRTEWIHKRFIEELNSLETSIYIIFDNQHPIGKFHITEHQNKIEIHDVGILPMYRRKGYCYNALYQWYQQSYLGHSKLLFLYALENNINAIQLYKMFGNGIFLK